MNCQQIVRACCPRGDDAFPRTYVTGPNGSSILVLRTICPHIEKSAYVATWLRLANCQRLNSTNHHPHLSKSTKEIIVIDDPFEKEAHSDHIFKEQSMPMQQSSHNLSNPYGGGFSSAFQEGSVQTSSTYYPHAFS
ncbi:hypothetical protein CTI12_AA159690 [Artemisia annua]|uniref:Uncharacterized protein n=1 Tax=Artemisia annua TaxID=35608 RepID=A0A2U1PF18_ARTAN|nr:hypothetical protein CTI12_AA159690 [Artemisia annua]